MAWSSLPLIEMDEVNFRKERGNPRDYNRYQTRDTGDNLERDIGRQLSAFREQTRTSKDNNLDKPMADEFGREVRRKPLSAGDERDRRVAQEPEGSWRRELSRSPRRWRDDDRPRDRSRGSDWGRDEPRRRGRDGYYSDSSEKSWDDGRNGERYREPPPGREPERYRSRDRRDWDYQDRDDGDWRRDRWEDRDDDRRRDDRRRDDRDRYRNEDDRYWSDNRAHDRDRYHDDRDYRRREYREEPSEIVMLKGLPTAIEDSQIHDILANAKLPYKDVRVVKTREGYSRGFAFVEFLDVETAKRWVDDCRGKLTIEDCTVFMDFSRSKMAVEPHRDWVCSKCGTQNFSSKRRNTCFTCNAPKDENDETKELGSTPCKVLILRGLDILTTEETIRQSLASFTSTPIFDVRLIKDKLTGTSRGFCFVELGSIEEATQVREELQNASFKVDEKVLVVSYAKFSANPSKPGSVAIGKTTSSTSTSVTETSTTSSTASQSRSHFAANAIAQARAAAQMGHTTDPVAPQVAVPMEPYSTEASVPAAQSALVAVRDPAVSSEVAASTSGTTSVTTAEDSAKSTSTTQPVSSYVYDAATGFYYDTTTGLHYDPNTQYYYNSKTQQYMYWDATTQQYVTVVSSTSETSSANPSSQTPSETDTSTSKEKQKKAKSLNAKKIAKDMERWAKKQAKGKDVGRPQTATQATQEAAKESSYQYDPNDFKGGIKISLTGASNLASLALTSTSPLAALSELDDPTTIPTTGPEAASSLVPEYGGDDSGGEEDSKEDNFTDWTKLACLLCKRQFPSKETLTRHNQLSDLHKQNMLVQKKLKMSFNEIDDYERQQREAKYRDRAKERRELFGQPDSAPPGKRKKKGKVVYEQPTKDGINSDNIGNKMLQAMGWTAGTGLGKDRQGIVDPISAKMRNRTAGLGLKGSDYGGTAGDSERDLLKKMAQSRYDESMS